MENNKGSKSFCRLCLRLMEVNQTIDFTNSNGKLCEVLKGVFPGMKFDILKDPVVCAQCFIAIKDIYTFKRICFKIEQMLQKLCQEKPKDLTVEEVLDTILREKETGYEHISDIEKVVEKEIAMVVEANAFSPKLRCINKGSANVIADMQYLDAMLANGISSKLDSDIEDLDNIMTGTPHLNNKSDSDFTIQETNIKEANSESEDSDIFEENFPDDNVVEIIIKKHKKSKRTNPKHAQKMSSSVPVVKTDNNVGIGRNHNSNEIEKLETPYELELLKGEITNDEIMIEGELIKNEFSETESLDFPENISSITWHNSPVTLEVESKIQSLTLFRKKRSCISNVQKLLKINLMDCVNYQSKFSQFDESTMKSCRENLLKNRGHIDNAIIDADAKNNKTDSYNEEDQNLFCDICQKSFLKRWQIKNHMQLHLPDKKFACHLCEKVFRTHIYLGKHIRGVHVHREIHCDICQKIFKSNLNLRKHVAVVHGPDDKTFVCKICQKRFKTDLNLRLHIQRHNNNHKEFVCDICQKDFTTRPYLRIHQLLHTLKKRFACDICKSKFKYKSDLRKHVLVVHFTDKKVACDICQKTFKTDSQLRCHRQTHNENKDFICDICQKGFKRFTYMKQHRDRHTNIERKFACNLCPLAFTTKDYLRIHKKTHNPEKNFSCEVCQKQFKTRQSLTTHKVVHIDRRSFVCHICQKGFKEKSVLKKHKLVHLTLKNFVCDICQRAFVSKDYLRLHRKTHNTERKFTCDICQKKFKSLAHLNEHMICHSDERNCVCDICQKSYKNINHLRMHKLTHRTDRNVCQICQISFRCRSSFYRHMDAVHEARGLFQCFNCYFKTKVRADLVKHIQLKHTLVNRLTKDQDSIQQTNKVA